MGVPWVNKQRLNHILELNLVIIKLWITIFFVFFYHFLLSLRCESNSSKEDKTRNKEHDKEKVKYKKEIIEENINDDAYIHNEKRTIKKNKFFLEKIYRL